MSDIDKLLDEPVSDTPAKTSAVDSFMKDAPDTAKGFGGALRDTAVTAGADALTGIQFLANNAGADNAVAQKLGDAADYVRGFETEARREERAARAAKIKAAEESGSTWEEIKANVGAFAEAPIDTTVGALGTSLPTIAAAALTRGKVRSPVVGALGGAQGAGVVKGAIYDTVEQEHLAAGATPEEAQARAAEAQSYGGDNAAQIALGAGLGVVAGSTGIEGAVGRMVGHEVGDTAAQGVIRSTLVGAAKEAPLEAAQGGQERLASNIALQNEGFDTPTWQGVAGQAALEGVAGAAGGAGFGAVEGALARDPQSAPAVDPTEPASEDPANEPAPTAGPTVEPQAPTAEPQAAGMAPPQVPQQYRTERPYPAKPSEQMGLDPSAGPLSDAAATAVDSGATAQLAAEQQAAEQAQKDAKKGAKAGEQIDTATGEITQAAGDLLAGDSAAELQDRLNFVKQAARANGWDARLVAERDRLQAELDKLQPQAKAKEAAKQMLDAGGTEADANRAATDSLIDSMAQSPDISIATEAPAAVASAKREMPPTSVQEGIAQAQARRAQEKPADQAAVSPETVTAPSAAEASTQPADQMAVKDESRAVEPSTTVEPVADQTTGDIKAITAKQIPQMTDAEIEQAIAYYGPDNKRTAKLQKEQAKRVTQGAGNVPQAAETVEASPQPAQVAGQAPADSAQATGAADAGSAAGVDQHRNAESLEPPAPAVAAASQETAQQPEFTTLKTTRGDTVTVRTADLNGERTILPEYTKAGKRKEGYGIHRENLDPTGEKRAARAAEEAANPFFDVITTLDGNAFASKIAAGREMNKRGYSATHEVVPASELQAGAAGFVVRRRTKTASKIEGRDLGDGWAEFTPESGTLNVPRAEMPQIKAEHRGAMVNFLNARGVQHEEQTVPAADLKPTQAEFSRDKVARARDFDGGNRSILISQDGHVLDGHHQWLAAREKGEDVKVISLGAPIRELVKLAHEFPSSTTDSSSEAAPASVKTQAPMTAQTPEQVDERKAAKAAATSPSLDNYVKDMAPNVAALAIKALNKQIRIDGKAATLREHIEAWHAAGELSVSTSQEPRIKPMSRRDFNRATEAEQRMHEKRMQQAGSKTVYYVNDYDLGKTAHDYAAALLRDELEPVAAGAVANVANVATGASADAEPATPAARFEQLRSEGHGEMPEVIAFAKVAGATGEKPADVYNRWQSVIGFMAEVEKGTGKDLASLMGRALVKEPYKVDTAYPGSNPPAVSDLASAQRFAERTAKALESFNRDMALYDARTFDAERFGIDEALVKTARDAIQQMRQTAAANERAAEQLVKDAEAKEKADAEAEAQAKRDGYEAADLRELSIKPTADKVTNWMTGTFQGQTVYSASGHLIDLSGSEPHLKGWAERMDRLRTTINENAAANVVAGSNAGRAAVKLEPLAINDLPDLKDSKQAVFSRKEGEPAVYLNLNYVRYFLSKFKGAEFFAGEPNSRGDYSALQVRLNGELVGILSPISMKEDTRTPAEIRGYMQASGKAEVKPKSVVERAKEVKAESGAAAARFQVVAINERTGAKEYLSFGEPMTQDQAIKFKQRFSEHPARRIQLEAVTDTPAAKPESKRSVMEKAAEAKAQAVADYFAPGNVVPSYGGNFDRVVSYQAPDKDGHWSVTVRAVEKRGDSWVDKPGERERNHMTLPDARELKKGPVFVAPSPEAAKAEAEAQEIVISYGGSSMPLKLSKPAYQATTAEVRERAKQNGLGASLANSYADKHVTLLRQALSAGLNVPADVLADYPGLIRPDLNDDQTDQMVDDLRNLSGAEFVSAAREWGKAKPATASAPSETAVLTNSRRDPRAVTMFNPYLEGDIVTLDGKDWTVRSDMPGWYLTNTGNWRGQHPTIHSIKSMEVLIREIEQAATATAEPEGEAFPTKEAAASYSGISHRGTDRAKSDKAEFEAYIDGARSSAMAVAHTQAQRDAVDQAIKDLRADYLAQYRRLMNVRAGTVSSYVAGGSNFNSKQASARNSAYDRAIEAFTTWQAANTHKARKAALDARTEAEKAADADAAAQASADKAQKKEDSDRSLMRKILSWKKGAEPVAIGKTAKLAGVNKGKDGYPTSIKLESTDGSALTDDKFDLAALFREKGMSVPDSKRRVRELVDAVRAEDASAAAQDDGQEAKTAPAADSKTPLLDAHVGAMDLARDGKITPEQFRAAFAQVEGNGEVMRAEMNSMSKDKLLRAGGVYFYHRHKDDRKAEVVEALYRATLDEYSLGKSYGPNSYMLSSNGLANHRAAKAQALRDLVAGTDEAALQQFAAEIAESRKEREARKEATRQALENPKTLPEFRSFISYHAEKHSETRREAYLRLTPEQRRRYDELEAEGTREAREQAKNKQRTKIASAGNTTAGEVIATKHTKHGHDLYVVKLEERVSREDYDTLNSSAKRMGGSYSSYRGNGAIPGFQFRTREAAEAFRKLVAGDTEAAQGVAQARRDAFEDDRSQSAVERLRTMAAALNERADEELGRDRKVNTARRARMASAAEGAANANKALAGTMSNIADAIEAGKAKFLDLVRQKVQVEFLNAELRNAKDAQIRAKYPSYADQERHRGQPIDDETVDYSTFPTYGGMRSDLAGIARQMIEVDGLKNLGQRLLKVADDVSDAYVEWAKNNLLSVSRFARGEQFAEFTSRDDAERAIRRSNLSDRAIVLPLKRGVNRIVLSPSEAMKQGIWQGDDKRIDLSGDFGREIVEAVGRRAGSKIKLPWQLETVHAKRKRLEGMGIYTGSEYRAALREFADLQQAMATPDKIKQMERAMIGRRSDGLDFFPTSEAVVDAMLEAAEIEQGMGVLEPSAGMGHIADAIREKTGVEPEVVELSGERRELLQAKGYHLAGDDFMAMQPRTFYTFGDVFQAPDGTKGIMHGGAAWSGRASLHAINEDGSEGKMLGWYDRDELTGIEQRGSWSGYDRIVMNPPFSKGRDIQHVQHAYSLLKPGGRLVAIMGEGAFFQSNSAAEGFRAWLDDLGATSERLPENSFMDAALPVNTAVNARMVVIDKPATDTAGITADSARRAAVRARVAASNYSREDEDFLQGMLKALYEKTGDGVLEHKLSTWLDSRYQRLEAVDQLYAAHDKAFAGRDEVLFSRHSPEEAAGLSQSSVVTGKAPANPLTLDEAVAAAERFLADYNGHIELSYRIRKTQDELYGPGSIAKIGVVKGAYHPGRGLFTLTADHLSSVADTVETLRHELLGHYGLDTFAPADKQALLDKILASKDDPTLKVVWSEISRLYSDKSDSVQAEEVFARLAEGERSGKEKLADLLYSLLTRLLRKVFGYKKGIITRRELLREIEVISKGIRNGSRPRQTFDSETSQRRGEQTDTRNFRNWFGDSKVVSKEGAPLVLHHGTAADFTVFDQTKAGSATGHATSALGIFMSSDRRAAEHYAEKAGDGVPGYGKVMDLYASIQNPYLMSVEESQDVESQLEARRLRTRLEQQGYDGIRLKGTPVWIAFNNYQVKSATDNVGTFDEFDPDIRFSRSAVRDMASNAANAIASVSVQDVKRSALGKWTDFLSLGLQSLGRRQLVDLYDGMLPMRKYAKLVERMDADKNDTGAAADELARRWGKLKDSGKLADLMHEATLAQTDADPLVPESKAVNPGRRDALNKQFEQLSPEAQAIYREARDAYKAHHRNVIEAIKERVKRSEMGSERKAELLRKMDSEFYKAIQGVYFPLARFGSYVVAVNGPDGKIASVHRAETMGEANALREQLQQKFPRDSGYDVGKVTLDKEFVASRDSVSRGFMSELYGALDGMKLPSSQLAELEDTLGQLYLASMPDLSWAKHGIHRKGTAGFSDDARRAFAQNLFHGARYLAKLRYGDRMQDELDRMQKYADARKQDADYDQPKAQRVIDEMVKRHESMMNPKSNPLSTALTSFGFIYYLGLSPAAAVVNLTQTALVAYPVMGAKWGFNKSAAALMKASSEAVRGKNDITKSLNPEELKAFEKAVRDGTIDVTQAHDLAGIAQGEDSKVMWKIRPVMRMASYMFHQAEVFNRQVTFIASYRLAREAGASTTAAYEQAKKATYDGHFDYSASNRPRLMQGNVAKVVLLFKQYAQNMIYTLTRNTYQAFAGESPAVRKEARKTIGAILALHAAATGVLGLPLVGPLLAMASAVGGDDDEPWDAEVALRNLLADALGPKASEVIARGLSRLGPADISGRVALNNLLLPDMQEGLEGKKLAEAWTSAMLGPVAGIFTNAAVGANHIAEGRYAMGLESMLPVALRNPLKSLRYADEGVVDRSGVVVRDEVGVAGIASQLLGFSPSEVRLSFEGKSAIFDADRRLSNRRSELMTQFARAAMEGDQGGMAEAREAIAAFNQKNPSRRIQANHLMQSVQARRRRIAQAEDGVYLPRNRADAREAGRFANPE